MTVAYSYNPDYAVPPGDTLREALDEQCMTQDELASRTGLSRKTINEILQGKSPITAPTAARLELATGVPGSMWNSLERNYQERVATLRQREEIARDVQWWRQFPYAQLTKLRAVPATPDKFKRAQELLRFFAVSGRHAWEQIWTASPQAMFRRATCAHDKTFVTASWLRIVQLQAMELPCDKYCPEKFGQALEQIRGLTTLEPAKFVPKIKELCGTAGVAFSLVPELRGMAVSGAALWHADRPIVALCLRGKANDKFWFTFFHESMHILHHGKKQVFLDTRGDSDSQSTALEKEANERASRLLIPAKYIDRLRCLRTVAQVKELARELKLHEGIVVGQHQYMVGNYKKWNHLKMKLVWDGP